MKNFGGASFKFVFLFSVFLTACTTTHDAHQLNSPATYDNPVQRSSTERAQIRLQLGINYLQLDQLATALKELNNAIAIDPTLTDIYAVRALVYMQMHDNTLAEQDFLRVVNMAPNNPDNINNYAWFLCSNGKEAQAMDMFNRVIQDRSYTQPVKALNNAGLCSLKMKNEGLAEYYFAEALRLDADNPISNYNLAQLSYQKQDWKHAQFYISRLIKNEMLTPESLWLAIKLSHKRNDKAAESSLAVQLRRRFPNSEQYELLQRGAFNE